jgi:hypothetical protein
MSGTMTTVSRSAGALALVAAMTLTACSTPACDPAATAVPVADDGVLFGVNLDWGTETLAEYADVMGSAPAVAVSFSDFPFSDTDRANVAAAAGQVAAIGGILLLTLEPHDGLPAVTDDALADLTEVLTAANTAGTPVVVRFAHEMNGSWYAWGQQPAAYIDAFGRVAEAVHAAPAAQTMWAPNYGGGYPFSGGAYEMTEAGADFTALDTDGDGTLTGADDPYAPYYPGDEAVDWVGMSLYHWGAQYPWGENEVPEEGKFVAQLSGEYVGANGDDSLLPDFYAEYGEARGKPVAIPETGALFAPDAVGASGAASAAGEAELDVKRAWWRQIFSDETRERFPRLTMINWFEWRKEEVEVGGVVDWTLSRSEDVREAFLADKPEWLLDAPGGGSCASA